MAEPAAAPARGTANTLLLLGIAGMLALAAGIAAPFFVVHWQGLAENQAARAAKTADSNPKWAYVPFGDVVVNLNEERLTRYLRVKLLLVVDIAQEKTLTDLIQKDKPVLKNWLIGHLSDKSIQEVTGKDGVNKLRREIWQEFNAELFPDGSERIHDIFFEEFVVQ